jgi:hypothetical protein
MVLEWMWELLLMGADVVAECVRVFKRRSPKTFNARVLNLEQSLKANIYTTLRDDLRSLN